MNYELHTLCALFPRLPETEFQVLCEDIKANGLYEPIMMYKNQILDGGNRYRACLAVGVEPKFRRFDGDNEEALSYVFSSNLHRRHLDAGQRAVIVSLAQDWEKAQKHGRPEKSGNVTAFPNDADPQGGNGNNQHGRNSVTLPDSSDQAVTLPLDRQKDTVADRAAKSEVSDKTQRMADKVARTAPDLAQKVGQGEVKLTKAFAQVTGKPSKPPKPAKPDTSLMYQGEDLSGAMDMSIDDILADMDALEKEKAGLEERIKALTADDLGKELDKQVRITQGIEARLGQEMDRANLMQQELRSYGKWFADLRKVLNLPNATRGQITSAVRELVNQRQEAF